MPPHQIAFAAFWLATCGYSLVRGGAPERTTSAAFLAAGIVSLTNPHTAQRAYDGVEWRLVWPDLLLLIILSFLALKSSRYWPILMAAMQLIVLSGHFAKAVDGNIAAAAYYVVASQIAWPMIVLLAVATARHRNRKRRFGMDFDWVWELPPAYRAGWLASERPAASEIDRS